MKNKITPCMIETKYNYPTHRFGSILNLNLLAMLLLLCSFSQVTAQNTTLFSTDFSSASWAGITNICNTSNQSTFDVYNGISFYSRSSTPRPFVVNNTAGTMTWCNNNSSSGNYFIAIPVTGVNGSITITIANGTTATRFNYSPPVAGSTPTTTTGSFAASVSAAPSTVTISSLTGTDYVVYLGRQGSGVTTLTSITITTPIISTSITGAATATAFTTTYGTTSAAQSFPVSGSGLTTNLVATAPTGFEVSSDGTTYGSTATFTQTSGSASGTLRIRLAATAVPGGSYNAQNIVLSSTGATSVNIGTAATGNAVSTKALTVTNLTASDKAYDGSTSVIISGSATLSGVNGSDAVTLGGTPSYSFETASAGVAKPVSTSGYTISGAQSSYYTLTQPTLAATISKVALTITAGDQIVGYGTAESTVTSVASYTATGFVNSETAAVIGGSASYTTNYTNTTAIGASGITITPDTGTLSATNYSFDIFIAGAITIVNSLTPQTISFALTSPVSFGSGDITLTGTATSGLSLSYVSSNPFVASVSGNVLTINNVGTTTITASQTGDATYSAAIPVSQTLDINCGSTSINTTTLTVCAPYTWSNTGQTYTVSGIYDGTTTNCVTEQLNLTINTTNTYYVDADGDGVGTGSGTSFCSATAPAGYATTNTDCDDTNASIWRSDTLYQDVDLDGYTDKSVAGVCYGATPPTGYYTAASSPTKTWNFSDTAKWPTTTGIGVDDIVNDQLGVYPLLLSATTNMGAVNASAITFPVTATTAAFTTTNRFQLNGGGSAAANLPTQRYVYFDVSGSCRVLVWFRTGGSSLRTLYVTDGTNVINSLGSTVSSDNLVLKANYTGGPGRLYIYGDQSCNLYKIEVTGAAINTPSIVTAPSLSFVPDTTLNTVDNDLDITFTDNAAWRNAVNTIKVGTTTLTSGTDYELTSGQLRLKPSGGNAALTSPGTKKVNIIATGYSSSNIGVSQTILVGNVSASVSNAAISAALAQNATSTITCTAKDQFGNPVSGYAFQFDITITNAASDTNETYVLDGVSYTSSTSGVSITAITDASGVATFTATLPAIINYADGISIQVKLADGISSVGSAFVFTSNSDASITQSPSTANQSICQDGVATPLVIEAVGAISYQWYSNAINSNSGGTLVVGANSFSYTPLTSITGSTYYYCVVNGVANVLTSDVSGLISVNPMQTYYADADGDGYGNAAISLIDCTQPIGYVANSTDCDDALAAVNPGHIEVLYNGIDDNCDGQLDEGFQMTSDLQTVSCGSTLTSIGSLIYADINLDATAYRFKVENNITGQIQYVDNAHHWFALNWLASYDYTTAYTVSVQLQIDGIWLGYYGSTCVVNSPSITSPSGTLQLIPAQCGATLPNIATIISTTPQSGATGYRFRITDVTPNATGDNLVQVKDRSYHWFTMQMLTRYNYGSTYMIEVAVKTTGGYTGYGSPCYVNTPAVPMLANCGAVVPTRRTLVYTVATKSVTQYRFQVTKVSDQSSVTFDTGRFWFSFRVNMPGYTPSVAYSVRVAVMTAGTWSPFGDACEIISPAIPRTDINAEFDFNATVFPNPFSDQFILRVDSDTDERIEYKVYDMLGKLIEAEVIDFTDLETKEIGRNYPAGVFNIIVMQGEERKTLRVIKR